MATSMIHRVAVQSPILALKDRYDSPYSLGAEKEQEKKGHLTACHHFKQMEISLIQEVKVNKLHISRGPKLKTLSKGNV